MNQNDKPTLEELAQARTDCNLAANNYRRVTATFKRDPLALCVNDVTRAAAYLDRTRRDLQILKDARGTA